MVVLGYAISMVVGILKGGGGRLTPTGCHIGSLRILTILTVPLNILKNRGLLPSCIGGMGTPLTYSYNSLFLSKT